MKNSEQEKIIEEHTLGENSDGSYSTPYKTTVIYHKDSYFETAVALLSDRAQILSIDKLTDYSSLVSNLQHPSPDVLIFGSDLSRSDIIKFFEYGCNTVYIFNGNQYTDNDSVFDTRVKLFQLNNLYDNLQLKNGMLPIYILEHIICAEVPTYKSIIDEIDHQSGNYFMRYISYNEISLEELIPRVSSTYKGFEEIKLFVFEGKMIDKIYTTVINNRISSGLCYKITHDDKKYITLAVNNEDNLHNIVDIISICSHINNTGISYINFYNLEYHNIDKSTIVGWRIILISVMPDIPDPLVILGKFADIEPYGAKNITTAWITTTKSAELLPFIYPHLIS